MRPFALLLPCTALLVACGESASGPLGKFQVEAAEDGAAFTFRHPSGLELSTVSAGAFGFRRASATYEMSFGSFLIEEMPRGDFVFATKLKDVKRDGDRLSATLVSGDDELGKLVIEAKGESLFISAEALGNDNRASITLECDDAAAGGFLGFGAQTHDANHRGQIVPVWVSEQGIGKVDTDEPADVWFLVGTRHQSYLAVPTIVAPRAAASYGLHATTFHRSVWDLCATDPAELKVETWEKQVELMISPGPSPLDVVRQQTALNGRIPPPPDWTFGTWMEAVGGTEAVRAEAALLRSERISASALWTEDWRGGVRRGNGYVLEEDWRWDEQLYPGLPSLVDELHADGFRFMTYFNTFVVEDVDVWEAARAGGHLVKDRMGEPYMFQAPDFEMSSLADLFTEESRAFVKAELDRALDLGIDGWMADFAEWYPADPRTVMTSDGSDSEAAHHRYPAAWAEVNREVVDARGRSDVVIFHRSGYSGSQGQAHVVWAGDQRTTFGADDGLPTVVPIMLGLSVAGFPMVTHDIAGYTSATNPPADKELFFRWTTLGALSPVMRTHHGRDAFLNWRWSSDEQTVAHFRFWSDFHNRLFPYLGGLARAASERGEPIVRPLAFLDPGDVRLHDVKDAYALGDAMIVAPILTSSTTSRRIELPRGLWYDFFTSERFEGGVSVEMEIPLSEIGLFVRAGAVIPTLPANVQSLEPSEGLRTLQSVEHVREHYAWLGANGRVTDVRGGSVELTSPRVPTSPPREVKGAKAVFAADFGRVVFTAAPDANVEIVEADGTTHSFVVRGFAADAELSFDVRW